VALYLNVNRSYGIQEGKPANLIIVNAENTYDIIRNYSDILYSIYQGKVLFKCKLKEIKKIY